MEVRDQDVLFWELAHHLVAKNGFQAVHVTNDRKQLWLEKETDKEQFLISLSKIDMAWSRGLDQLMKDNAREFQSIKRGSPRKNTVYHNVYITSMAPADDWKSKTSEIIYTDAARRKPMQTWLFAASIGAQHGDDIEKFLGWLHADDNWPSKEEMLQDDDDLRGQKTANQRQRIVRNIEREQEEAVKVFTYGKSRFTYILLALILMVFVWMEAVADSTDMLALIEFGAKYNPFIDDGEWWRIFTSMFLHIGIFHLFMNSLALLFLGTAVERIFGTTRFIWIYMVAGIVGSTASYAFTEQVSAGASGAIFGCFGALVFFGINHRRLFFRTIGRSVIVILLINVIFGTVVPMVDNGAHMGGLVGGFLAAATVGMPDKTYKLRQLCVVPAIAALIAILFAYGYYGEGNDSAEPIVEIQLAQELMEEEAYDEAYETMASVIERAEMPEAYFMIGNAAFGREDYEEAEGFYQEALAENADFHEAAYNLALVYGEMGEDEQALEYAERALELEPDNEQYEELLEELQGT
ncbi:rhomboid family intramembrane serine protease [Salicibibacter cibi]|uniref:Rhomboid family intramembrane serine protease n=1 Tax=Salicibibacter cibi TaxID=2743001 RepID=A0A7T7CF44_9BACI|nr:rhomboid family intramembrane serine protease [Salicibibacter cibi]QQK79729.1 rhomboid family intramembrane serine protease [Salicibibacter cibi]